MARRLDRDVGREPFTFAATFTPEQEDALVQRVVERLQERRDDGFIDAKAAGEYLGGITPKAVYALVQRERIRTHRAGGRLLFDPVELREDVERGE